VNVTFLDEGGARAPAIKQLQYPKNKLDPRLTMLGDTSAIMYRQLLPQSKDLFRGSMDHVKPFDKRDEVDGRAPAAEVAGAGNMGDYAPVGIVAPKDKSIEDALRLLLEKSPLGRKLPPR